MRDCYGEEISVESICPLDAVEEEPFIARCCRSERGGLRRWNGRFGAVVHWGASPREIADAVVMSRQRGGSGMVRVAVVEGDGIGHEVIPVARTILQPCAPILSSSMSMWATALERTGCACGEEEMASLRRQMPSSLGHHDPA